jgi:outer membrane protein assembly factor BamA
MKTFSKYYIHSISALLSYKNTNSLFNPKSGNYGKIEYEKGGNLGLIDIKGINFYRITINGAHFIKLNEKSVIGMHSSMGIFQTQDTSTFDTESFVIGGVNSVRGYNENDFPFHGTRKITYNLEYRQDLTKNTQWVAFLDAGKTFETGWSLTNDFHFGKGVGVRFFTPVGPIRLDYARGEQDYFIHLGLGQLF